MKRNTALLTAVALVAAVGSAQANGPYDGVSRNLEQNGSFESQIPIGSVSDGGCGGSSDCADTLGNGRVGFSEDGEINVNAAGRTVTLPER